MNFKKRLTLLFVGLSLAVFCGILVFIYMAYSDFRREEFFERLREKSVTTVRLLAEVKEIDKDILKLIDRNTINEMYDEKILIFDENDQLIYSSLDDETIAYSPRLINKIRRKGEMFTVDADGDEVVGVRYQRNHHDYVVLASAYDTYGISKLENLRNLIIAAMLAATILIGLASYFYVRQVFRPIEELSHAIRNISENNLQERVVVKDDRNELAQLARNYNQMLDRLFKAFESQRAFVRNASHELKTPLAVMLSKLESLQETHEQDREVSSVLTSLIEDLNEQSNLIESLLLIQRLQSEMPIRKSPVRLDSMLEECVQEMKLRFPTLQVDFDLGTSIATDAHLTIMGNDMLIKTCFNNLIANAALYSTPPKLFVSIIGNDSNVQLTFSNPGNDRLPEEVIFQPFFRQPTNQEIPGSGLGLPLVAQIAGAFRGSITYTFERGNHLFTLTLPHLKI